MENTKQTIVDAYFSYWQSHIKSIEEEKIRTQFDEILIDVGQNLYGIDFALELSVLILRA